MPDRTKTYDVLVAGGVVSMPASSAADLPDFGSCGALGAQGRKFWTTTS